MSGQSRQHGGSAIGLILTLAILAYGVYVGIQYIPQYIESTTVSSVLNTVAGMHKKHRFANATAVEQAIDKQLNINDRDDLKHSFTVTPNGSSFAVTVSYERELNLLYGKKLIPYDKTIILK